MLILSICIPSYNRFNVLENTLKSIFKSKSEEFEVVVVDNGSTEEITERIKISDPRLRIIKRNEPVTGIRNINECLKFARGKYAFLCLDKDRVIGENLSNFIKALKAYPNIFGGYCVYNKRNSSDNIYICRNKILKNFGYLRKHPTGDFYRTECIIDMLNNMTEAELECTWGTDLLLAGCAAQGIMMKYDYPLVYDAEGTDGFIKNLSYSYSEKLDNLYFSPKMIIGDFHIFLNHLKKLPVSTKIKQQMFFHLYRRTMSNITIDYRQEMANKNVCTHYHTVTRIVPGKELWDWWNFFIHDIRHTDCSDLGIESWIKMLVCFGLNIGFLMGKGKCFFTKNC